MPKLGSVLRNEYTFSDVAPVVLPASRQHHFRSTARGTATSAEPSQPSHGSTDSGILSRRPPAVLFKLPETVPPSRLSPPSAPDKPGRKAIRSVSVRFCSGYRRISRWLLLAPSEGARKYSSRTYATRKCKGPQCPSRWPWL